MENMGVKQTISTYNSKSLGVSVLTENPEWRETSLSSHVPLEFSINARNRTRSGSVVFLFVFDRRLRQLERRVGRGGRRIRHRDDPARLASGWTDDYPLLRLTPAFDTALAAILPLFLLGLLGCAVDIDSQLVDVVGARAPSRILRFHVHCVAGLQDRCPHRVVVAARATVPGRSRVAVVCATGGPDRRPLPGVPFSLHLVKCGVDDEARAFEIDVLLQNRIQDHMANSN